MPEIATLANPDPADTRLIIGCGYLGRRVAAKWLAQGRRVAGLTRSHPDELRAIGIEPIVADVMLPTTLQALPKCGTTVYCVGFDRGAGKSMHDVYVDGLANVLAALPNGGRLIYVSSTGVYGDAGGDWVDETTPPNPTDEGSRVVWEAEQLLQQLRPDAVILRLAGIYGPGRLLRRSQSLRSGEPIADDPDKWLNLIHVDDGASAVLAAAEYSPTGHVYNISDGNPVRRSDFFSQLAAILGAPPPIFVPGERDRARGSRRISNQKMREALRVELAHPDYRCGLDATVRQAPD
jgi:nucleoside-diphosphate-sugar epimerase